MYISFHAELTSVEKNPFSLSSRNKIPLISKVSAELSESSL